MDIQQMKALWQHKEPEPESLETLKEMIKEKSHPQLQKIKRQVLFETMIWIIMLCFYYTALDGDKRLLGVNFVFVLGFVQAIFYNLIIYRATRNLVHGSDLISSLTIFTRKLKRYQWVLFASRVVLMIAIIIFFSYGLELNIQRLISMGAIILVFALQLVLLYYNWNKRLNRLSTIIRSLNQSF